MNITNPHSNLTPQPRVTPGTGGDKSKYGILLSNKAKGIKRDWRLNYSGGLTEHSLHLPYVNVQ